RPARAPLDPRRLAAPPLAGPARSGRAGSAGAGAPRAAKQDPQPAASPRALENPGQPAPQLDAAGPGGVAGPGLDRAAAVALDRWRCGPVGADPAVLAANPGRGAGRPAEWFAGPGAPVPHQRPGDVGAG